MTLKQKIESAKTLQQLLFIIDDAYGSHFPTVAYLILQRAIRAYGPISILREIDSLFEKHIYRRNKSGLDWYENDSVFNYVIANGISAALFELLLKRIQRKEFGIGNIYYWPEDKIVFYDFALHENKAKTQALILRHILETHPKKSNIDDIATKYSLDSDVIERNISRVRKYLVGCDKVFDLHNEHDFIELIVNGEKTFRFDLMHDPYIHPLLNTRFTDS